MLEPKDTVHTINFKGFTNTECEFFPCHKPHKEFNCLFCYCPLVFLECKGTYTTFTDKHGQIRKDCTHCTLPHHGFANSWKAMQKGLERPVIWEQHNAK